VLFIRYQLKKLLTRPPKMRWLYLKQGFNLFFYPK
jgi:hypothetical protein